ncbi:hypothetical protein E5288_WYG008713 [Bos mutus]|uniref:Uncharacterized protein n=1 Tax=Bos mutus TaxID=72004 RepID=A0A6B0RY82_9CETA|nr:hypothetical protein [Bos mutus]
MDVGFHPRDTVGASQSSYYRFYNRVGVLSVEQRSMASALMKEMADVLWLRYFYRITLVVHRVGVLSVEQRSMASALMKEMADVLWLRYFYRITLVVHREWLWHLSRN